MSVIGYRFWRVLDDNALLRPSTIDRHDPRFDTWVQETAHAGQCTVPDAPTSGYSLATAASGVPRGVGTLRTRPRYRPHVSPLSDCECGLYCYNAPAPMLTEWESARKYRYRGIGWPLGSVQWVCGAVEIWGHAIRHEHGYRVAHARIRALCDPDRIVTDTYNVPRYVEPEPMLSEWFAPADDREAQL